MNNKYNFKDVLEFWLSLFLGLAILVLLSRISDILAWIIAASALFITSNVVGKVVFRGVKKIFKID